MKRTLEQNRIIWGKVSILAKRTGLGREAYEGIMREICKEISGSKSTSHLTKTQASKLIAALAARVHAIKPVPDANEIITRRQQETLRHLYKDAGIHHPQGFCQRIIKRPWPQTRLDAAKVHQALANMVLRKYPKSDVLHMLKTLDSPEVKPHLSTWEQIFITGLHEQLKNPDQDGLTTGTIGKLLEIYRARVGHTKEKTCATNA